MQQVVSEEMGKLSEISVAILAGGLGTRLRSIIDDRPKVLAQINGKPFLAYLLDQLLDYDVKSVILCTGYEGEKVKAEFGDTYKGLRLVYSQERIPLGTAGALGLALPFFESQTVLILNGDSYCDVNLVSFWQWHHERKAEATMLLAKVSDTKRFGRVEVGAEGSILSFDEKNSRSQPGWINAGIYLAKRPLLERIPMESALSLEREVFPTWIGRKLYGYRSRGPFLDIGTPESFALAEQFFDSRT